MSRPRRQVYTMKQYLDNVEEGYIANTACTQRNPKWRPIIDGLVVTIGNDEYIPPLILAEDESGKQIIVDGGSRTTAYIVFEKGNYRIKSTVKDPIIKYNAMEKDENGNTVWREAEFDIRNKTFTQFPKELKKKFYEYQVETVVHECSIEEAITKYLPRYNEQSTMNANEKAFIQLPKFANKVREIINRPFFVNCINPESITETQKEKGLLERIIFESVMCMFHFDKWNKNGKKLAGYLNQNATEEEFEIFEENISRLEKVVDDARVLFSNKDTFIWLALFEKFKKLGLEDNKFGDFLNEFAGGLREKEVDGMLFDEVDKTGSTKDKRVIGEKLHILETLMNEYLHINKEDLEEVITLEFVEENVKEEVTEDDVEFYSDMLDDLTLEVNNDTRLLDDHNRPSLIALVGYACEEEKDGYLEEWIKDYFSKNTTYLLSQKENFSCMKANFDDFIEKIEKRSNETAVLSDIKKGDFHETVRD